MINPWKLLARTKRAFGENHGTQMAAAIAYQVLFSFIPLVTVLLAILGFVLRDPQQQRHAVERVLAVVPLQSDTWIYASIRNISTHTGALTVLGVLGILWTASGLIEAVRAALNTTWGVRTRRGFITEKLRDLGAVLGLGILLVASLAGTMTIHLLQTSSVNQAGASATGSIQTLFTVLGMAVPAAFSFLAFLLLYRYVPNVRHRASDVWPGAVVATLLFELAKHGFAFYVSHFNNYQALYGALGAVMLFMLWTDLSAIIMLIGAGLASEYENMKHERHVEDEPPVVLQTNPHFVGR